MKRLATSLLLLLVVSITLAAGAALILRVERPETALFISPFEVGAERSQTLEFTGSWVAHVIGEDLVKTVDSARGLRAIADPNVRTHQTLHLLIPAVAPIEVRTQPGEPHAGVFLAAWNRLRQVQFVIGGDAVVESGRFALRARLVGGTNRWETPLGPASYDGVRAACHDLSRRILSDFSPAISGLDHIEQHDFDGAFDIYEAWAERQPAEAEAQAFMGVILQLRGDPSAAVPYYQATLAPGHANIEVLNDLGTAFADLRRYNDALRSYQRALELRPNAPDVLNNQGGALMGMQRRDEAIGAYRSAVDSMPDDPDLVENLGLALAANRQFDDAIPYYRRVLTLRPMGPQGYYDLADAQVGAQRYDDAVANFNKALSLKPDYPDALNDLAVVLAAQGKFDDAISSLRKALTFTPDDRDIHHNLGLVLRKAGQEAEAEQELVKAGPGGRP